jgi:hypothetical protein
MLRGHVKSNSQYTLINSKTRNGTFGLKGWVSTHTFYVSLTKLQEILLKINSLQPSIIIACIILISLAIVLLAM